MFNRKKSHILLAYEALFRMLLPAYRTSEPIRTDYIIHRTGFLGEKNVDYKLSLFPRKDFLYLPGLRLHNSHKFFQIDSLLLTPKVLFLIEVKNMKGTLEYYSSERQLIQRDGEEETAYQDPLLQAMTQKKHLQFWLDHYRVHIPIETIIVSANSRAIIKNVEADAEFAHRFVTLDNLIFKLDDIYKTYHEEKIPIERLRQLRSFLLSQSTPLKVNLLEKWNIQPKHLMQGIPCVQCGNVPLKRVRNSWKCANCSHDTRASYHRAVLDYFLLIHPAITTSQFNHFFHLNSMNAAYRILRTMELEMSGANKNRIYLAPPIKSYPQNAEPSFVKRNLFH